MSLTNPSGLVLFIFMITVLSVGAQAQQLVKSESFGLQTPFLEPDNRKLTLSIGDETFVILAKKKGGMSGKSAYLLERRTTDLQINWSELLEIPEEEELLEMTANASQLILFSVTLEAKKKQSTLSARIFDLESGRLIRKSQLMKQRNLPEHAAYNKGKTRQQLEDYIEAGSEDDFLLPFQYRFYLTFSPDRQLFMAYYFDRSKKDLLANAFIFDQNLEIKNHAQVPVDKGYFNEGFFINNEGVMFILNTNAVGDVAMIRYDLSSKESVFLKWQGGNMKRTNYKLDFATSDKVYVACLAEKNQRLKGVLLALFDYNTEEVKASVFHPLTESFQQQVDSAMRVELRERASWKNFDLLSFEITPDLEKLFVIERRAYISSYIAYEPGKAVEPDDWKERKGNVETGEALFICLNDKNDLKWSNFIVKKQNNIAADGLNSLSMSWNRQEDKRLQLIFAQSSNPIRGMNQLEACTFDWQNGKLLERMTLPMDEKYSFVRKYTIWTSQGDVISVGRKAFSGRASLIMKFNLEEKTARKGEKE